MRIALTGATGYTGGHVLRALAGRGDDVAALVRDGSGSEGVEKEAAEIVSGDLRDLAAIGKLVDGADAVVHIAAVYRTAGHPDSYYRDINYGGTVRLLDAAAKAGVRRFVHTSTVGVLGHVADPPGDETSPLAPSDVYQETKAEAEVYALRFGEEKKLPVAVVRPAAIYGPGETRLLKLFRAIARGRYAIVGSGTPSYHLVHIDDLVQGFLLALDHPGAPGEAFIIAGERALTQRELADAIASATGGSYWPFRIPALPIQLAGSACEAVLKPFGIDPPLHRRRVDFWTKNREFSIAKACRVLGYEPRVGALDGIASTAAWYREAGWL